MIAATVLLCSLIAAASASPISKLGSPIADVPAPGAAHGERPQAGPADVECDLLVVGAGVSGAFTAARFRQFNPDASICIVERSGRPGGRLQSLPLYDQATPNGPEYQAEFGGMRYDPHSHRHDLRY